MTTQSQAYTHIINFPETEVKTIVSDECEISCTKKGIRVWEIDFYIQVFCKDVLSGKDSEGRKHVDYSMAVNKTDIVKEIDGKLYAKYGRKFYPLESFVCAYVAQPCIYV